MKSFRQTFTSEKGVIDLPSIITGVIITGILAAVVSASLIVVIPWFQTNAAKDDLTAVQVAETTARQDSGQYASYNNLTGKNYLTPRDQKICIQVLNGGSDYEAFVRAANNKVWRLTSATTGVAANPKAPVLADTIQEFTGTLPCTPADLRKL
jgi:hypothetical protein